MRRLLYILALVASATAAEAQTPTPWLPASTPAADRPGSIYKPLLASATAVNTSAGVIVAGMAVKRVQVVVGSCSSYTLLVETSHNGSNWVTEQTISEANIAASSTGYATAITAPVRYLRTRLSAVSSCTVSTFLLGQ